MKTPLVSVAWVVLGTVIGSFGAVFLKVGAGHLTRNLKSLLTNWRLALGIALYLLSSVFYVIGVRNGELSVLYPMVSLGDRKSTRLNSSHSGESRMPSSA